MLFLMRSCPAVTVDSPAGAAPLLPGDEPVFHDTNRQLAVCLRFVNIVLAHASVRLRLPSGIMMVSEMKVHVRAPLW